MSSQTAAVCPNCGAKELTKRQGVLSVVAFLILFFMCVGISGKAPLATDLSTAGQLVSLMSTMLQFVFLVAFILSAVSAAFGKNKCLSCRHQWR